MSKRNEINGFKVGDWVFCDLTLKQIKGEEEGKVREVSDGYFCTSGSNLTCFPLTLRNKTISEHFENCHKMLHQEGASLNLNYPDFLRYLVDKWIMACEEEDNDKIEKIMKEAEEWTDKIVDRVKTLESATESIDGVRLFRQ